LDLFAWRKQVAAVVKMVKLLKKGPNVLIAGRILGRTKAGEEEAGSGEADETVWKHDVKSFKKMFHEACDIVGEAWETEVTTTPWKDNLKLGNVMEDVQDGVVEISFVARRLEKLDGVTSHKFVF